MHGSLRVLLSLVLLQVVVYPADESRQGLLFALEALLAVLPRVIVMGIPSVERAVINKEKDGRHQLLVEGTNLQVRGNGWQHGIVV